ncbi:hypothetical protein C8R43DRAFT_1178260 [Mycena crocata]|nr:hypothetical protein C8R43DRAFT_1178260 [Mycena crocata]
MSALLFRAMLQPVDMALLPGHLIFGYHTITHTTFNLDIQLYPAASFDGRWHPLGDFDTDLCIDPSEISSLPVPIAFKPLRRTVGVCVIKNPLHDYTLMVEGQYVYVSPARNPLTSHVTEADLVSWPAGPTIICLFHLALRRAQEPMVSMFPQATLKYISRHAFLKSGRTSVAGHSMTKNAACATDQMQDESEIQSRELPIEAVDGFHKLWLSDSGAVITRYRHQSLLVLRPSRNAKAFAMTGKILRKTYVELTGYSSCFRLLVVKYVERLNPDCDRLPLQENPIVLVRAGTDHQVVELPLN